MPAGYSSTEDGPFRDTFARGIYGRTHRDEEYGIPCFEVCANDKNNFYHLTPNSLLHVRACEGGSRVSEHDSRAVTADDLFANPNPDPSNVGTFFRNPSYYLWEKSLEGDDRKIVKTEFIVATDRDGRIEILDPPAEEPYSMRNLDEFSKLQDPNSNMSSRSRQSTSGTKRA